MTPTALKIFGFLPVLMLSGMACAADGASTGILERWQADKTTTFEAADIELDTFKWIARPVVVFADSANDPAFRRQIELLEARRQELVERDVVLIIDTDPDGRSELRTKLRPRGFMLTLIGKDGGVKLRKPFPWDVRELSRQIDKMPIRRQELLDARDSARGTASE